MLFTRNAYLFRKYFKEERSDTRKDFNFVGSLFKKDGKNIEGFASLSLGNREDIGKYLSTVALNVAADDQAIYELIQNADDSRSTTFSVNYNEKYLLCINNGNYFSNNDMSAIINVAGNYKDGEDIGTFGIGFKILHRLVGPDDGRDAIINGYAGPIIFSWKKFMQLEKFINGEEVRVGYDQEKDIDNPWLVKILYTCFPTHIGEELRLGDYETQGVEFDSAELTEMRDFLRSSLESIDLQTRNNLRSGSIFFLKLGAGKHKFLVEGIDKIKSGLSYSFKFLNHLKRIYINGEEIEEQRIEAYSHSYPADSDEFRAINPKNKNRDIRFTFAFYKEYKRAENLRDEKIPNLYTFFSMEEEKNGMSFILHCNAFDMNNDRRKLQANSQINEQLLPQIAVSILAYASQQKGLPLFYSIYASLLLSKEPKSKEHINRYFFSPLKTYICENIPTKDGFSNNPEKVKIKNTALDIQAAELGCPEISWFHWYNEKYDGLLLSEARDQDKLALETWNIIDLLRYAVQKDQIRAVNDWILRLDKETVRLIAEDKQLREANPGIEPDKKIRPYNSLIREINRHITRSDIEELSQIKLFKFSDGLFYSINDITLSADLILNYEKTFEIRFELQSIGFKTSYINIKDFQQFNGLMLPGFSDLALFQQIQHRTKENKLRKDQKHRLFTAVAAFDNVGPERLKELELFKDAFSHIRPLKQLLKGDLLTPDWLHSFKIHQAEYISDLDGYLVTEKDIYRDVILPNWAEIIARNLNVTAFYQKVKFYYELDEKNAPLKNEKFIFINNQIRFLTAKDIFYNSRFIGLLNYQELQSAISGFTVLHTPARQALPFLKEAPFKLENANILDLGFIENTSFTLAEIKSVLTFCKSNNESFFQNNVVAGKGDVFLVSPRTSDTCQVRPSRRELGRFIGEHLRDQCYLLPFELDEYREEAGVSEGEALYERVLSLTDIDKLKDQLVSLISYDEPKKKFLLGLSELRFIDGQQYDRESTAFKILEIACQCLSDADMDVFRKKVVIAAGGRDVLLADIPPVADKVQIQGKDLLLSKVLQGSHQNSAYLSTLLNQFIDLGLPREKLNRLFNIAKEPDPETIFTLLAAATPLLENEQQLAFLILYSQIADVDFKKFEVETLGGNYHLDYPYYTTGQAFLSNDAILASRYEKLEQLIALPIKFGGEQEILITPFFRGNALVCPYIKDQLTDSEKIALIQFLYNYYIIDPLLFNNKDWSVIGEIATKDRFGFDPRFSVYPDEIALQSEQLPDYLKTWINGDQQKLSFLSTIGVWTENTVLVKMRRFFTGQGEFNSARIAQEAGFKDEIVLLNTLKLLKLQNLELHDEETLAILTELVRVVNTYRDKDKEMTMEYEYDRALLDEKAVEWDAAYYGTWKKETGEQFLIFLYDRPLPQILKINEIKGHVFHRIYKDNVMIDEDNQIFINRNADIKTALSSLIALENDFTAESLLQLYQAKEGVKSEHEQVEELRSEVERLRRRVAELEGVSGTVSYNATVSYDDSYHQEIKEISERYLYNYLQSEYPQKTVIWLNYDPENGEFLESWKDHDFEIKDTNGNVILYIDCKGTPLAKRTFYLTANEWHFSLKCKKDGEKYAIYRVFNVAGAINHTIISDLHQWIETGRIVPYLSATETIKGGRVFLTLSN